MTTSLLLLGEKGYTALKSLDDSETSVIADVTIGTDKNVRNDYSAEIEKLCLDRNISFSYADANLSGSYIIAIGWRKMVHPAENQKLIVLHDSLLPRYRGFNPLVTALINGDREVGVTALFGEKEYDNGDIIAQEKISVHYPITIAKAIEDISVCYSKLLKQILSQIKNNSLSAAVQNHDAATYSLWRDAEDYFINWESDAEKIERFVNAIGYPYEGAKFRISGEVFSLDKATALPDVVIENRTPGKVIFKSEGRLVVVCGSGLLRLDEVTDSGGQPKDFGSKFRLRLK